MDAGPSSTQERVVDSAVAPEIFEECIYYVSLFHKPISGFFFAIVKNYLNVNYKKHMAYCTNALLYTNKVYLKPELFVCIITQ